jgi:putative addiction module component (TIGR02574 family)
MAVAGMSRDRILLLCHNEFSDADKLQVVQDLWDDISPESVPVFDWQKEKLAERQAHLSNNPTSGIEWPEMRRRIRRQYGR